jgi:Spy/CpxP family protein refolding chaperone
MKRMNVFWKVMSIVTVCSLCIAFVGWAQSENTAEEAPGPQLMAKGPENFQQHPGQPRRMPGNAQRPEGMQQQMSQRQGGNFGMGFNLRDIELTEDQKTQMQSIIRDFQTNTATIRQKLQFAYQDLRAEMQKETVDQAKVDGFWAEITELKTQLGEAQANQMLAMKGILTPEQLEAIRTSGQTARELQALKAELREVLLAEGAPDVQQLQALQAQIAEKEVALEKEKAEKLAERKAEMQAKLESLTPEEREKIEKFRQLRQNRDEAKSMRPKR